MRRVNYNSRVGWGSSRPDSFTSGGQRRQQPVDRRNFGVPHRPQLDDRDLEVRQSEEINHDDSVSGKLDRLLDRLDRFDAWRDETDRRFQYLEPPVAREAELPSCFEAGEDWGDDGFRYTRYGDRGYNSRYPNGGLRDDQQPGRGCRGGWGQRGSCWDPPGYMQARTRAGGFDQSQERPSTCWDPPQRFQANMSGYDQPKRVHMDAPRFDGTNASNGISRVQFYFNHLMIPPAQQSSEPLPTPIQTQGGPGRAVDQARPPRVRVSQAEKAERARLGLCYYCPDKWLVSHVCKQRLLCYSDENDLDENGGNDLDENVEKEDEYDDNDLDGSNLSSTTTVSTSSEEHLMVLGESDTSSSTDSASRGKNISNSSMCSPNCTNIDHLEEIIADARNIKKTLFGEMESVINLMKQAEVKEHAAEQANTEAARVEMDAQNEIKELKITIKHATEASGCIGKGISRVLIIKKLCGVGKTFAMDLFLKRACVDNAKLEHATYECMFMALLCEGSYKGRHSTVRYVFDPGGYASPKLSTIIVLRGFHLEDKVDFNRGRVDTILYPYIPLFSYIF